MWFFVSDLHGRVARYRALFERVEAERPGAVLLGGDLLPSGLGRSARRVRLRPDFSVVETDADFVPGVLASGCATLRERLGGAYPKIFLILGNDDPRVEEAAIQQGAAEGLWEYIHEARTACEDIAVFGYACVPPTPFMLKDWERYDVSRYVDPGCVSPEEGWRSVPVADREARLATIADDLEHLGAGAPIGASVWLFHSPPHDSALDRAALDGVTIDHAPVDVHVGSIAIRRFIEARQPLVTLHGHIHESARLTGSWRQQFGRTWAFSAAHDGPELTLVRFDPRAPDGASRELIRA